MGRPAGLKKTGGRKKGTPNKRTTEFVDALAFHGIDVVEELARVLPKLPASRRVDVLVHLLNFVYPKRKSVEVSGLEMAPQPQVILTMPGNGSEANLVAHQAILTMPRDGSEADSVD